MADENALPTLSQSREFYFSSDKHLLCVSSMPSVFIIKSYPLPFDIVLCLALGFCVSVFIAIFDLVWDLNNDCLHFKRCHIAVYICSNLCVISKHMFLVFPFCFRDACLAVAVFRALPFWSWAEEPQLILINPELSFLFITVTLASFLFINVTLAANLNLLISKVDGNHSSVCVQIATHQQGL